MGLQHHVFGPAGLYVSVGQSVGTVGLFGMTVDGVNIEVINYVDPIHDDRAGPNVSTDEQRFGQEARISGNVVWYDEAIRAQLFAVADNGTLTNEGAMGYAGVLFGLGTVYYNLVVQAPSGSSPTNEGLWNFPYARLLDATAVKVGTVKNVWNCIWKAVNYLGTSQTLLGSVLYKHTFP
jgi:hypothetical protein